MRKLALSIIALLITAPVHAEGNLYRVWDGCYGPWKLYHLHWHGPWSKPQLNMDWKSIFGGGWSQYAGGIPTGGCISSPDYNRYYIIEGCEGQNCQYLTSAVPVVYEKCGDEHNQ
jgi:hypothetical protein